MDPFAGNRAAVWLRLGQWHEAIEDGKNAVAGGHDSFSVGVGLMNVGIAFHEAGQPDEAIHAYTSLLAITAIPDEQRAEALLERGMIYLAAEKNQKAFSDVSSALGIPGATEQQKACAFCYRAICHNRVGRRTEAAADARIALNSPQLPTKLRAVLEANAPPATG
jgi:tetratricopeptide (TPR) repeat protein